MEIYKEEIFGPVLSTVRAGSYEEALKTCHGPRIRQRHRDLHPRRRRGARLRLAHQGRHGRRQRADPGAAGLPHLRRLEEIGFGDLNQHGPGRLPLLHQDQDRHAIALAVRHQGRPGPKGVSTVLVENGAPGLSFGANERKMGWKAQPTSIVQFDDCAVPAENLVGEEGKGFTYAMMGLDGGRLNIAACSLGAAQNALDKAARYMHERKAFGKSLADFQALQFKLADMETELQAARTFLRQAAWKLDNKTPDATKFCAMAKRFVTDTGFRVANEALQIHGGYGYLADYGVEKIVRDLRVHQILEGTNEIMRVIVARHLLDEAKG
jgi:hypothetical protein